MTLRWAQLFTEWHTWWKGLTLTQRYLPVILVALYWIVISRLGSLTQDHFVGTLPILLLYYGGRRTRPAYEFFLPFFLTVLIYDSMRYYADYIRGPVHVREPYDFDKYFFGIREGNKILTPAEWFQIHNHPILDLITGFFYIAFIPIFVLLASYFRFYISKTGTKKCSAAYVREQSPQIMWAFFWLNIVGYSTYYWYPASPPWYADMYGFGPAKLDVLAQPGGCIRFDQLLGTHIFTEWYGRAADVHGAMPSLHIAYPLLAFFYSIKFGTARVVSFLFYAWLCFSAVYVNQHYIIDVIVGSIYALTIASATHWAWNRPPKAKEKLARI